MAVLYYGDTYRISNKPPCSHFCLFRNVNVRLEMGKIIVKNDSQQVVSAWLNPPPTKASKHVRFAFFTLSRGKFDFFRDPNSWMFWILDVMMELLMDKQTSGAFRMSQEMRGAMTQPDIAVS